jgi:hypothetical protein
MNALAVEPRGTRSRPITKAARQRVMHSGGRVPLMEAWANGHLPELLYKRGSIDSSLPFARLKAASRVDERARGARKTSPSGCVGSARASKWPDHKEETMPIAAMLPGRSFARSPLPLRNACARRVPARDADRPRGAGGGTDATARIIGSCWRRSWPAVTVVNRTGGSGVVGHSAIAQSPPDGYTIGLITVEIGMMHWQGLTDLKGSSYTPLGLVNADPAGLQVRADAPYKTVKDLVDAIKADPGKHKASGTGQGGIWHLALAGISRT